MVTGDRQQTPSRFDPGFAGQRPHLFRWLPVALALALAMILAASSSADPARMLIVLTAAWMALIAGVLHPVRRRLPRGAVVIGLAIVVIPLFQVLPLPLALTESLPGHEPVARAAAFLGTHAWRPLSLDVEKTWRSFLAASGCTALLWATVMLDRGERLRIVYTVLAVAFLGLLLGVVQITSASHALYFQADAVPGTLTGFFGNRNHEGTLLIMAAALTIVLIGAEHSRERKLTLLALALVFVSGAIATRSRAAILLLLVAAVLLAVQKMRAPRKALLAGTAACAGLFALVWLTPVGHSAFGRFLGEGGAFGRLLIWRESLAALREVFPVGTGMGTFAQVYGSLEPLESVSRVYINHAHSEILQVPIELGLPGVLVVLGIVAFWLLRMLRPGRDSDLISQGILGCLALPLLHSLADYPLRAFAMAAVACVLLASAFPPRIVEEEEEEAVEPGPGRRRPWGLVVLGCAMIALVAQQGVAAMLTRFGRAEAAARIMPFSASAHLTAATQLAGDDTSMAAASAHAAQALWFNAYSGRAWALLGYAELKRGDLARADQAFLDAARLGWRDHLVQAYVFQRAAQTGAAPTAASAADALLRRRYTRKDDIMAQMAGLLADSRFREALAVRLAERPSWRGDFIDGLTPTDRPEAVAQLRFFQALAKRGMALQSQEARAYLERVRVAGSEDMLLAAWRETHGQQFGDPGQDPLDTSFEAMDGSLFPLGWLREGDQISQILTFSPGQYELSYSLRTPEADRAVANASLRCSKGRRHDLLHQGEDAAPAATQLVSAAFAVPARQCRFQVLSFPAAGLEAVVPGSIEIRAR